MPTKFHINNNYSPSLSDPSKRTLLIMHPETYNPTLSSFSFSFFNDNAKGALIILFTCAEILNSKSPLTPPPERLLGASTKDVPRLRCKSGTIRVFGGGGGCAWWLSEGGFSSKVVLNLPSLGCRGAKKGLGIGGAFCRGWCSFRGRGEVWIGETGGREGLSSLRVSIGFACLLPCSCRCLRGRLVEMGIGGVV